MFFHLGIPVFVSVINTWHLVACSGPSLHLDFDIKMCPSPVGRSFLASHLAACIGMINVTNHLLTQKGQAFALLPITLLLPAVFFLPLYNVESLYLAQAIVSSLNAACPSADTCLQSNVRISPLLDLSLPIYLLCLACYVVNGIRYS